MDGSVFDLAFRGLEPKTMKVESTVLGGIPVQGLLLPEVLVFGISQYSTTRSLIY